MHQIQSKKMIIINDMTDNTSEPDVCCENINNFRSHYISDSIQEFTEGSLSSHGYCCDQCKTMDEEDDGPLYICNICMTKGTVECDIAKRHKYGMIAGMYACPTCTSKYVGSIEDLLVYKLVRSVEKYHKVDNKIFICT